MHACTRAVDAVPLCRARPNETRLRGESTPRSRRQPGEISGITSGKYYAQSLETRTTPPWHSPARYIDTLPASGAWSRSSPVRLSARVSVRPSAAPLCRRCGVHGRLTWNIDLTTHLVNNNANCTSGFRCTPSAVALATDSLAMSILFYQVSRFAAMARER